jgi:hypothetical protein
VATIATEHHSLWQEFMLEKKNDALIAATAVRQ